MPNFVHTIHHILSDSDRIEKKKEEITPFTSAW